MLGVAVTADYISTSKKDRGGSFKDRKQTSISPTQSYWTGYQVKSR